MASFKVRLSLPCPCQVANLTIQETSVSRPVPQMGTLVRQPQTQRSHSHSISLGAINANHRVTRRKSMSRRGTESTSIGATSGFSSYLSRGIHAASPDSIGRKPSPVAIDENTAVEGSGPEDNKHVSTKNRNRRASEGSHLVRGEGKRVSTELRCDQCGKGYKHSSCLTKHMCVSPDFCLLSVFSGASWLTKVSGGSTIRRGQ